MRDSNDALAICVLATRRRDVELACSQLDHAGIAAQDATSFDRLLERLATPVGALLVTDDAVPTGGWSRLAAVLGKQPAWSDVPLIVCCREQETELDHVLASGSSSVTVISPPAPPATVISAAKMALRARRRQYELRDLLARYEDADRHKDEFLAMLGHELRTPIAAIQLALQVRSMRDQSDTRQIQVIERQVKALTRIVDDLLDISRVTLGKIRIDVRDIDICEIARRCVQTHDDESRKSNVELVLELPGEPLVVRGDHGRVEQILSNLLANAIKYTPSGGRVLLLGEADGATHARLVVRDTGIGIAADVLPTVFELFSQARHGLDRSRGGIGLGLSLVRRLVEMQGGAVEAASDGVGKGSTFTVKLPLATTATPPDGNAIARTAGSGGLRVLVVEDNDDSRQMLAELLAMQGQHVVTASDGLTGVRLALETPPDVMLVDIGLPGLDGYQIARQIRDSGSKAYLIAMTGYGQPADRERAFAAGFDHFLVKPIDFEEVERAFELCVRRGAS